MPTVHDGGLRLRFNNGPTGHFLAELRTDADWRVTSLASAAVEGIGQDAPDGAVWEEQTWAQAGGVWIEATLRVSEPVTLDPSMILWLGELDHLDDRQAHTWRQTILRAPTTNQAGLGGNDLPAGYLYDHSRRVATMLYFPPDSLAWADTRLLEFTLSEVLQYRPQARYGFGLVLNPSTPPLRFEAGTHQFRWWITQQQVENGPPTPWQAQRALLDAITPLLHTEPTIQADAPGWSRMAQGTAGDLENPACWIEAQGVRGLRAYVRGSSSVGRDEPHGFELMTQLDVLHPLLVWQAATSHHSIRGIIDDLRRTLPHFRLPDFDFVANGFPLRPDATGMDTWYFLENALIKLPWVAALTQDAALIDLFAQAMRGADKLIEQSGGLTPLFADAADWKARGALLNAGAGGLYAAGAVLAAQLLQRPDYLVQAWAVLRRLHRMPPAMLTHEPQQLGYGAAAAGYLADHGFGDEARMVAGDLVRLSLRMGYWTSDPAVPLYDARGMFQACASLCYPAFKENVETLLMWPALLASPGNHAYLPVELMAAFANLQRCHNYAFFDDWLPANLRRGPCSFVPYEDLATSEFPHTATLGKEVYGAGEVFWSALLFDAHGQVDAPDVLCLSLDVPGLDLFSSAGRHRFLLYNPASESRVVRLSAETGARSLALAPRSWTIASAGQDYVHTASTESPDQP
jgi:hypothetical protein